MLFSKSDLHPLCAIKLHPWLCLEPAFHSRLNQCYFGHVRLLRDNILKIFRNPFIQPRGSFRLHLNDLKCFCKGSYSHIFDLIFMLRPCLSDKALDLIFHWFERLELRNSFIFYYKSQSLYISFLYFHTHWFSIQLLSFLQYLIKHRC